MGSLLFFLLGLLLYHNYAYEYLGCYHDRPLTFDRDLSDLLFLEDQMTLEFCDKSCGERGFEYFGLQASRECWCGHDYGKYGRASDSQCRKECGGNFNQICGGDLYNSIYKTTKVETPKPKDNSGRPLFALVMIVKNEAHTLPQTLISLKPYLDYYYILDTGSTDGTQEAIIKTLGTNGEIWEEPFIDYGTSRNRVLDIAQQGGHRGREYRPIFCLMLSADETVINAASLRTFMEEHRDKDGAEHEAYTVRIQSGWIFDSLRLSRTDKGWRYRGRVHEYLSSPDDSWHPQIRVPNTILKFEPTDHERRSKREYTILNILLEEKEANPQDTRTSFYLARTYDGLGMHEEALQEFRRRIELGGWQEEVYESLYAIPFLLEALGKPWAEVQQAFLEAFDHSQRAEPLYAIAHHYYRHNQPKLCYVFAAEAAQMPFPEDAVLWVNKDVYDWESYWLISQCARDLQGQTVTGAKATILALSHRPDDETMLENYQFYLQLLGEENMQLLLSKYGRKAMDTSTMNNNQEQHQKQPQEQQHEQKEQQHILKASKQYPNNNTLSLVLLSLLGLCCCVLLLFRYFKLSRCKQPQVLMNNLQSFGKMV